ncbi:MAG TPA: dihydrofolate reductase [Candidatus Chromulinivoraceae bacterium]|nr:dihydrofolate reductase [Candidatus Chromulinivoraceae bacterium]
MISYIVAADKKGAIGKDNLIPWRIRSDLASLKQLTLGKVVILGRKTYDSMAAYYDRSGRPMPGRLYIVITRDAEYTPKRDNVVVAHSPDDALKRANQTENDIFVIGGSQIYELLMPYADRIYLTEVDTIVNGDTFFSFDKRAWHETSRSHHEKSDRDEYDFDTIVFDRIA